MTPICNIPGKRFAGVFFAGLLCLGVSAQDFPVSAIPAALLEDANAVIRLDDQRFEIVNEGKLVEKNRFVVTVLNEKGEGWAEYEEAYNRFHRIQSIEGYLYDAAGKQIGKMKTKDAIDLSGNDGSSLIEDTRVKRFTFTHRVYPYTVDFTTEWERSGTLFFPAWYGQPGELISVQQSSVTVISPANYTYRFRAYNYPGEPERKSLGKTTSTRWMVQNIPAFKREPYSPMLHEYTPMVLFGPSTFKMDDYEGDMSSWESFGRFMQDLIRGRDVLPADIRDRVHQLTDHLKSPDDKVRALYKFLQKNTRYISIQLGIGGYQPFDAKFVAAKAYGDCKALTNYMYSLLKEAGIPSHYALVRAGRGATYLNTEFPSSQFNHVILCVPMGGDTTWLECTSQSLPAGYLGDHTNDRPALLVSEQGGKIVMTKRYPAEANGQKRRITAQLSEDGSMQMRVSTQYTGLQMDGVHSLVNNLGRDRLKEYLQSVMELATYDVTTFNYSEDAEPEPAVREELDIAVTGYANISGKRIFLVPNLMNRMGFRLPEDTSRKHDLVLPMGYLDIDSISIAVPGDYQPEMLPAEIKMETEFGEFQSRVKYEKGMVSYYRRLLYHGGRIPAARYGAFVEFLEKIRKADRSRLVLVKAG